MPALNLIEAGGHGPAAASRCAAGAGLEGPPEHQAIIQAARVQLTLTLPVKSSPGFYSPKGLESNETIVNGRP